MRELAHITSFGSLPRIDQQEAVINRRFDSLMLRESVYEGERDYRHAIQNRERARMFRGQLRLGPEGWRIIINNHQQ